MREVMYWISFALMLFATGMNAYAWYRSTQNREELRRVAEIYRRQIEELKVAKQAYEDKLADLRKGENDEADAL